MENIESDIAEKATILPKDRQVWLTSYWGFDPQSWGGVGFTYDSVRTRFLEKAKPGALVVIYFVKSIAKKRGRKSRWNI